MSFDLSMFYWNESRFISLNKLYYKCLFTLQGHSNNVECLAKINNTEIISGSSDKTVKIWNIEKGILIKNFSIYPVEIYCLIFLYRTQQIVSAGNDIRIQLANLY